MNSRRVRLSVPIQVRLESSVGESGVRSRVAVSVIGPGLPTPAQGQPGRVRLVSDLDLRLRNGRQGVRMTRIELVPERTANGTIVLRVVERGPLERLRRAVRRWLQRA